MNANETLTVGQGQSCRIIVVSSDGPETLAGPGGEWRIVACRDFSMHPSMHSPIEAMQTMDIYWTPISITAAFSVKAERKVSCVRSSAVCGSRTNCKQTV